MNADLHERGHLQALVVADVAYLYDARDVADGGTRLVAARTAAGITLIDPPVPNWMRGMLDASGMPYPPP